MVDLGASPGGWLQVAREIVGPEGLVIGVDIKPISPIPFPNVHLLEGDIYDPEIEKKIVTVERFHVDVVDVAALQANAKAAPEPEHRTHYRRHVHHRHWYRGKRRRG